MKRILVLGVSAGSGKSTFAKELAKNLRIPVYFLDRMNFEKGWKEVSANAFKERQQSVTKESRWIIEGNYSSTLEYREGRADTIIYLSVPLITCLFRVVKRRIRYHGKTRPELGEGCPEKLDYHFLKYIITTYEKRKKAMKRRLENYRLEGKEVYCLSSRAEIKDFLNSTRCENDF